MNSFRLKIALLSGCIAGLLLAGSGFVLWQISHRFSLDRLDREIRQLGQANLDRVTGPEHWARLDNALQFVAGNHPSSAFVVWVKNGKKVIYQSPGWPENLNPDTFPTPETYEGPNAPKAGDTLPSPPRHNEPISSLNPALPLKTPYLFTSKSSGKTWRVGVMGNPYMTLALAADMGDFESQMAQLRHLYLAAMAIALILVAAGAWLVSQRALKPVVTLTQTAERITARGLDQRIPAMAHDEEFNRLITVFNEMMTRLEQSFRQATRFSADASHELKTPLARLQMELEQALQNAPPDSPQQEVYSSLLDEISHLKAIIQKLLLLSMADAGQLRLKLEPVDLTRMLENVIEDCQVMAPNLTIEKSLASEVTVQADPDLLEQAVQNLASNAIKYNCAGGKIRFELEAESDRIAIRVSNTGTAIVPADRARVFDRFYRGDVSRSQQTEGTGLGLSLSREILRAHGGDLTLANRNDGLTQFVMEFPLKT